MDKLSQTEEAVRQFRFRVWVVGVLVTAVVVGAIAYGIHAKQVQDAETGRLAFCNMTFLPDSADWRDCMETP